MKGSTLLFVILGTIPVFLFSFFGYDNEFRVKVFEEDGDQGFLMAICKEGLFP